MESVAPILAAFIAAFSAANIIRLQPATKEDANRNALHELEMFCPPKWNSISVKEALEALSNLYKLLQYASRDNSFIITRAAAWEMIKILRSKTNSGALVNEEESQRLYIWKTLIANLLSKKNAFLSITCSHRRFKARLHKAIVHTKWVISIYDHMNNTSLKNYFPLLESFENKLTKPRGFENPL